MRALPAGLTFSRRQMIGAGTALSVLAPSRLWAQSLPGAMDTASMGSSVNAGRDRDNHMTVAVTIDGRGPFHFVVDTGADHSVLADTTVEALGLAQGPAVIVEGVVRSVTVPTVRIAAMAFGERIIEDVHLPVLPRAWLMADGYIGLDMLAHAVVTLDFRHNQLTVERSRNAWLASMPMFNGNVIPAGGPDGHLRVLNCRVDAVPAVVFIDTGAEVTVGNIPLWTALREGADEYQTGLRTVSLSGVTGGEITGAVADFKRIKIRDVIFTNGTIAFADMHIFRLWNLTDRPALLVGMNFLRQFSRVSIDYGNKALMFEVSAIPSVVAARETLVG